MWERLLDLINFASDMDIMPYHIALNKTSSTHQFKSHRHFFGDLAGMRL